MKACVSFLQWNCWLFLNPEGFPLIQDFYFYYFFSAYTVKIQYNGQGLYTVRTGGPIRVYD